MYLLLCRREAEAGSPAFVSWALSKLPPRDVELWANEGRAFLLRRLRLPQCLGMRATHPHQQRTPPPGWRPTWVPLVVIGLALQTKPLVITLPRCNNHRGVRSGGSVRNPRKETAIRGRGVSQTAQPAPPAP